MPPRDVAQDEPAGPRERALASAERLVAERGFAGVRLRDVSIDAGVSVGSLQHYFGTRDGMLRAAFLESAGRRARRWAAVADERDGGDPWRRLIALLRRAFDEDLRLHATIWIEFCAVASRDEEVRAVMASVYDQWRAPLRAAIEDGVAAGRFNPVEQVDVIVDLLATQIDGVEVAAIIAPAGVTHTRLEDLVLATARAALRVA